MGSICTLLLCASTSLAAHRPSTGELSPRLAKLSDPSLRVASPAKQAQALSLAPEGPGSLLREGSRVLAEVRFDRGARAAVDDLRALGAKVLDTNPRYQRVTVAIEPADLRRLSAVPRVAGATEVLAPVTAAVIPCFGNATSEGDTQLRAAEARELFGVDGSGVTVGILSDSFGQNAAAATGIAGDVASGDLPGASNPCERKDPVGILDDTESKGKDEGRAMAQIVHDLAPGAKLAFATAFKKTMFGFADNIRKLAEPVASGGAEADVIVDDVFYFEEPFFQEGPVGVAVREVTEGGVNYFSSAGNNNLIDEGRDFASWEAPEFRDAPGCPAGLPGYAQHCMDFDPGAGVDTAFGITVSGKATLNVDLQWAQPWEGVTTDLDAYLLNAGNEVVAKSENFNLTTTQTPYEGFAWANPSSTSQVVRLAIDRCATSCDPENGGDNGAPRLKFALLQNGGGVKSTEYEVSSEGDVVGPTIFGHNGAKDAMSVGAIRYNAESEPEFFSSRGPVTHYFGPADGVSQAPELLPPEPLSKPDVVATDGGANTFFGSCSLDDVWRFFGTSAAAPHAAAVAALQRQALPAASAAQVSQAQRTGAVAVGAFPRPGPAIGAGMLDAVAAIEALGVSPSFPSLPEAPPSPIACLSTEPEEPEPEKPEAKPTPPTEPSPGPGTGPSGDDNPRPPGTFFQRRPPKVLLTAGRSAKAAFRFGSTEAGAVFLCRLDRAALHRCPRSMAPHVGLGSHVLRVKARGANGLVDPTPAIYRFRVERAD